MTIEDRTRHDRLRSLLPRTFATEPSNSALGVVVEVLADALREADQFIERALRDKWLRTSSGARPLIPFNPQLPVDPLALPTVSLAGPQHPLELLGAALALGRQPWESDHEAYRSRVRILGPMLAEGLATPRVLLAATLTSLGAEPCPILEKPDSDSTRGFGLPPRSLERCRVCKGGKRVASDAVCPLRSRSTMRARVIDNPRTRAQLTRTNLGGGRIHVRNDSLFSARPEIVLSVPSDADPDTRLIPSFLSLTTGEELVMAVLLHPGDVLTIRPAQPANPPQRHLQHWVDSPASEAARPGYAWIRRAAGGVDQVDELSSLFISGPRFNQGHFASGNGIALATVNQFAGVSQKFKTPELAPGDNNWMFHWLGGAELGVLTNYGLELGSVGLDLDSLGFAPATSKVAIELRWWTRAPARFRIRVGRTPAVERALASGAAETLRQMIDRVRPAGVLPILEFELEPLGDVPLVEPDERLRALELRVFEALTPDVQLRWESQLRPEQAEPDEQVGFLAILDVTRFAMSRFGPLPSEPEVGQFDSTYFDHVLL